MTTENIAASLRDRFAQSLKDCYKRRIIFWYDSEREFESMLDELDLQDVKILRLTGDNFFEAKMLLSETDTESNYLVYHPISMSHVYDDWLRDIELYSEEFRADLISMQMDELHIPQTVPFRRTVKTYQTFFGNKERVAKLASLHTKYETAAQLHIDIMAVLTGAKDNSAQGVIRAILCESLYNDDNAALEHIRKFGNEDALKDMLSKYTGYHADEIVLSDLAKHVMITALSGVVQPQALSGLEKYISADNQAFCYNVTDEWAHSEDSAKLFELANDISQELGLVARLEKQGVETLLDADCLPCIGECIISHYMNEISEDVIKSADILAAVDKRRTSKWAKHFEVYYDGLYAFAQMHAFYLEHITGFHYGTAEQLWKAYCDELFLMDTYYRNFHVVFRKSLKSAASELDDLFKNVADAAERIYKNWYLTELNSQWCTLIRDGMETEGCVATLPQQKDFYTRKVLPFVKKENRVFVIISDAFRYEVAAELNRKLLQETGGTAEITAMQSVFPSLTKYGMAALLPHEVFTLTDDLQVICDGQSTDGTESRDKILKALNGGNCAVIYEDLLAMKQAQRRELVSKAEVVYIYHNKIDAIGDKSMTENQVFDACEDAVDELLNLVKLIVNTMNGTNILITADHGFLYSYQPLEESDKGDKSFIDGTILKTDRRCIVAETGASSEYLMQIPMRTFGSDKIGFAPLDTIRIKKQGGGMNFVHGGIALQECCVPVITFKNIKASSKRFVDTKKVPLQLLSRTRKIANNIFFLEFYQPEAVGGKTVPATYEMYICDRLSNIVSDIQTIIADKTTESVQDRVTRLRFTLKGQEFSSTDPYYLNIVDKNSGEVKEHIEFSIKIAFANDFGF